MLIKKCKISETEQFKKIEAELTKTIKGKLQRMLRGINNVFSEKEYKTLAQNLVHSIEMLRYINLKR